MELSHQYKFYRVVPLRSYTRTRSCLLTDDKFLSIVEHHVWVPGVTHVSETKVELAYLLPNLVYGRRVVIVEIVDEGTSYNVW